MRDFLLALLALVVILIGLVGNLVFNWWHGLVLLPFLLVAVVLLIINPTARRML